MECSINNNEKTIQQIFQELEDKAKALHPTLLADIKSYNENQVALDSYQAYMNTINQSPVLTTSNHVS